MTLLTDIAIEHTYKGKKSPVPLTFTMHPYENSVGEHRGKYEIVRDFESGGRKVKRSAHVNEMELVEVYARHLHEQFKIRLRLRSVRTYPDSPPGKWVPSHCIEPNSHFFRKVQQFDVNRPISPGLKLQLQRLSIG